MSLLTNKSEMNYAAAEELQSKSYYCSSVHCSYYSCVQLMMHIILFRIGFSQQQLYNDYNRYKSTNPKGSGGLHEYYINLVFVYLRTCNLDAFTFNREIFKLKQTRTNADYNEVSIGVDDSRFSIQKAEIINKIIKKAL